MNLPGKVDPKYAVLLAGVSTGLISPEAAAQRIAQDLEASGVDVKTPLARAGRFVEALRLALGKSGASTGVGDRIEIKVTEIKR